MTCVRNASQAGCQAKRCAPKKLLFALHFQRKMLSVRLYNICSRDCRPIIRIVMQRTVRALILSGSFLSHAHAVDLLERTILMGFLKDVSTVNFSNPSAGDSITTSRSTREITKTYGTTKVIFKRPIKKSDRHYIYCAVVPRGAGKSPYYFTIVEEAETKAPGSYGVHISKDPNPNLCK